MSQESKEWLADPANRVCDAPGSWYCVGRYPPALEAPPRTHKHIDDDNGAPKYRTEPGEKAPRAPKAAKPARKQKAAAAAEGEGGAPAAAAEL